MMTVGDDSNVRVTIYVEMTPDEFERFGVDNPDETDHVLEAYLRARLRAFPCPDGGEAQAYVVGIDAEYPEDPEPVSEAAQIEASNQRQSDFFRDNPRTEATE